MKTRNKSLILMMVVLLTLGLFTGCSQSASTNTEGGAEPVKLKLAHFFPASHPVETDLIQPWAAAVKEATEGRVLITSYPGGTLLQADAVYDGVVNGIADMGTSCFSYNRGTFPVLEVFELPGIEYVNSKSATKVAWEGVQQLNPEEIQDTKLMMVFTTGPGDLYTKDPIRNLDDLQGMEIRATGLSAKTLEVLGAVPVAMAQSEAYEALSKGVVKGNLGPDEVLEGWKQAEVTQYLTKTPFLYNTLFYLTMNLDKWDTISAEDQQTIQQLNEKFFEEVAIGLWDKQNESALKFAAEQGMETITLSEEEQAKWIGLVEPVQKDFINQMNDLEFNGQEILDTVKNLADQYNKDYQ